MRRLLFGGLIAAAVPGLAVGQSSQFGIRGLGIPIRAISPRATATGGAFAPFDIESGTNPASIGPIVQFTALFSTAQSFRSSTNPFGSASGRDSRFPHIVAAGPIGGTRLAAAVSLSGYTDRSFSLGTVDSIDLRGTRVAVFDTLSSRGGLSDVRLAGAWRASSWLNLGVGLHAITGSNRIDSRKVFSDSTYAIAVETSQLSYLGLGVSAGIMARVASTLTIAGVFRTDGHANIERDTLRIAETDLPTSWGLAVRWQPTQKIGWAASYQAKNWSTADADIRGQGGIGAENVFEASTGIEIVRDLRNPGSRPLRFGTFYHTLPFPLRSGKQAHEYGISAGTGFRFTAGRGGLDLSLQQLWRSDGDGYTERATILTLGFSLRP
jgi:hypothetical protein